MSYINENNIYTSRKSSDSQCNVYGKTPIEAVSYSSTPVESDVQVINNTSNTFTSSATQASCDAPQPSNQSCGYTPEPKPDCDFSCNAQNNCCSCDVPNYNPSLAKPICTFVDYICDETKASGSTLFFNLDTSVSSSNYTVSSQIAPICCNSGTCSITPDTKFTIESSKVVLKNFKFTGTAATSDVLVNGNPVLSVQPTPTGISATIDPSILDQACSDANKGTKVSLLLNALDPWEFLAKYELCGKIHSCGDTCKFKVSIENLITIPEVLVDPATFVTPELCLPSTDSSRPIVINIDFTAVGQLINPTLTGSTTNPCVTLAGKLMISTGANVTSLQNTKVCFPAVLANSKSNCSC